MRGRSGDSQRPGEEDEEKEGMKKDERDGMSAHAQAHTNKLIKREIVAPTSMSPSLESIDCRPVKAKNQWKPIRKQPNLSLKVLVNKAKKTSFTPWQSLSVFYRWLRTLTVVPVLGDCWILNDTTLRHCSSTLESFLNFFLLSLWESYNLLSVKLLSLSLLVRFSLQLVSFFILNTAYVLSSLKK